MSTYEAGTNRTAALYKKCAADLAIVSRHLVNVRSAKRHEDRLMILGCAGLVVLLGLVSALLWERSDVRRMMRVELRVANVTIEQDATLMSFYERRHTFTAKRDMPANSAVRNFQFLWSVVGYRQAGFVVADTTVHIYTDSSLSGLKHCAHMFAHLRCYAEQAQELGGFATDNDRVLHHPSSAPPSSAESSGSSTSSSSHLAVPASPAPPGVALPTPFPFLMPRTVCVATWGLVDEVPILAERDFRNLMRSLTALWRVTGGNFAVGKSSAVALSATAATTVGTYPTSSARPFHRRVCHLLLGRSVAQCRAFSLGDHCRKTFDAPTAIVPLDATVDTVKVALANARRS